MKIGILGTGLMDTALGTAWAQHGHEVIFSYARDPQKLKATAEKAGHRAKAGTPAEAAQADVVLMAIKWLQVDSLLAQTGSLAGKIVISCMLPMTDDDENLALGFDTSGAEELTKKTNARIVGTFNTVWSNVISTASVPTSRSMFYVGDDAAAKQAAETLIKDAGFEPVDAGELSNARLLEPFGLLMGKMGFAYDPLVVYRFLKPE